MAIDSADCVRIVQNKTSESEAYLRQLHIWLGTGSAGGAVLILSLAAKLPDPAVAVVVLGPSLWSLLIAVVAAGASLFFLSIKASALAGHYAAAHNRDQLNKAINSTPDIFASPPELANRANLQRNGWIDQSLKEHKRSEREYALQRIYSIAWRGSLVLSSTAFIIGIGWPLLTISLWGTALFK